MFYCYYFLSDIIFGKYSILFLSKTRLLAVDIVVTIIIYITILYYIISKRIGAIEFTYPWIVLRQKSDGNPKYFTRPRSRIIVIVVYLRKNVYLRTTRTRDFGIRTRVGMRLTRRIHSWPYRNPSNRNGVRTTTDYDGNTNYWRIAFPPFGGTCGRVPQRPVPGWGDSVVANEGRECFFPAFYSRLWQL